MRPLLAGQLMYWSMLMVTEEWWKALVVTLCWQIAIALWYWEVSS